MASESLGGGVVGVFFLVLLVLFEDSFVIQTQDSVDAMISSSFRALLKNSGAILRKKTPTTPLGQSLVFVLLVAVSRLCLRIS